MWTRGRGNGRPRELRAGWLARLLEKEAGAGCRAESVCWRSRGPRLCPRHFVFRPSTYPSIEPRRQREAKRVISRLILIPSVQATTSPIPVKPLFPTPAARTAKPSLVVPPSGGLLAARQTSSSKGILDGRSRPLAAAGGLRPERLRRVDEAALTPSLLFNLHLSPVHFIRRIHSAAARFASRMAANAPSSGSSAASRRPRFRHSFRR